MTADNFDDFESDDTETVDLTELLDGADQAAPASAARKPRKTIGRPSKRTPETRDRLVRAAGLGFASMEAIARAAGISKDTLDRMRRDDPGLDAELSAAKEAALDRIEASVLLAATEDPRIGLQVLRVRRPAYADRGRLELTGADGGPVRHAVLAQLPALTDDELASAVRALEAVITNATAAAAEGDATRPEEE
jgi:transposase-like protein